MKRGNILRMYCRFIKSNKRVSFILILVLFLLTMRANALIDGSGNYYSKKFKLTFKKPPGKLQASHIPVFFKMPGVLIQYVNPIERITYTIVGMKTKKPLSVLGQYLRFHISGPARNIEIVEDNVWLLKENAITLMQRYKCYVKKMMFYINVFLMMHKDKREKKVALMIASPHHHFKRLRYEGYNAYLTLKFID